MKPNEEDNADLIARLREPSTVRAAFSEVIEAYSEQLYWQIRRLVQNHHDADDVLQNTFLKAWSNIENFRGEAKLSTWLHKIAINESLSFLEREKKHQGVSLDDENSTVVHNMEADRDFDGNMLAENLNKAIETLPEKQRLVFNMKYFDNMKYERISEILGTSVGALKASYHLAVKKIEQFFNDLD